MAGGKSQRVSGYPDVITRLPAAEIHVDCARAWILQAEANQLVFFEFEPNTKVPEHSHDYPQWGMVIDGEMELMINGKPLNCRKGTEYIIPAGAKHSATFSSQTRVMDYFSEKNRYSPKINK